jgi:hypothetical protein
VVLDKKPEASSNSRCLEVQKIKKRRSVSMRVSKKTKKRVLMMFVMAFLTLTLAAGSQAALQAVGPVDPVNGFPVWYQDTNGVTLGLCLDPVNCLPDPVDPANPFSVQIGFGGEAFWWGADALLDVAPGGALPTGGGALLVLAVEAAFLGITDPNAGAVDGEQMSFSRLRIRIDAPVAGTYTVTHPYGLEVFNVVTPGIRAINDNLAATHVSGNLLTIGDIGCVAAPCDFTLALAGGIGPYLTAVAPPPPAGFLGSVAAAQTVTGSPNGTNLFRVEGPAGSNLGGPGIDVIETDLFAVQGRFFSNVGAPGPLALGNIKTGSTVVRRMSVRNNGLNPTLAIGPITVTPGDFTIASDLCSNVTLAANASCEVQMRFTKATIGASTATLSIPSDDPQFPLATVPLSATGVTVSPFTDVPEGAFGDTFINSIFYSGITAGCGGNNYCPDAPITRAQMAVFLETSLGTTTAPPCNGGIFTDVNPTSVGAAFCGFIEKLSTDGITGGCGPTTFCPNDPITRGQMAVFIEAALRNPANPCGSRFTDVPATNQFCGFIDRLAADGISGGCGGTNFCPDAPVTRAQMAVFLGAAPAPLVP